MALIGEHVVLKRQGREHVGLCPFHDDRSPSMHVVTHKGTSFYKCFACGTGGNAIDFVMGYHHMEFGEALRHLAERAGIQLSHTGRSRAPGEIGRAELLEANLLAMRYFRKLLTNAKTSDAGAGRAASAGVGAARIIAERRITDAMSEAFGLGAAADRWDGLLETIRARGGDERAFLAAGLLRSRQEGNGSYDTFRNRLIFPICDELGKPIAFGGRKINPEDEPKYVNSPESPLFSKSRILYGLHLAKQAILARRTVVVTEGYTDVIACHQAGLDNVVATLGTALTRDHARVLKRLCETVILLFDGDEAGMKAADRAVEVFFAEPIDVRICTLPDGLDPDDLLRQPDGRARFESALAQSEDALTHMVRRFALQFSGAQSLSGRQQRLEAMLSHLASLGFASVGGVRKRLVLSALSDLTGVPMHEIERSLPHETIPKAPRRALADDASGGWAGDATDPAAFQRAGAGFAEPVRGNDLDPPPADLPPYLVEAERSFLAAVLRQPESLSLPVLIEDGERLSLGEAFPASSFLHPAHRAILDVLITRQEMGASVELQYVLDDLRRGGRQPGSGNAQDAARGAGPGETTAGPPDRVPVETGGPFGTSETELASTMLCDLASSLFLKGHRRIETPSVAGSGGSATDLLAQCRADLDAARARYLCRRQMAGARQTTIPDELSSVIQSLDALRQRGNDPAAIARSVRS
ncbi:MAG: DNA primase [Phycisphaerales bacterium]|nr:DNA primase [Phycisphaerales bacterium]